MKNILQYKYPFLVFTVVFFCLTFILAPLFSTGALLLLALSLGLNRELLGQYKITPANSLVIGASVVFALLYANSLIGGDYSRAAQFQFEKKLSFLFIPLLLVPFTQKDFLVNLFKKIWIYSISVSLLLCFALAAYTAFNTGNIEAFFYHSLGKPFKLTATYYSFMIAVAVFFLMTLKDEAIKNNLKISIYLLLYTGIFLLSARMLQVTLVLILAFYWMLYAFNPKRIVGVLAILLVGFAIAVNTNVGNRYKELFANNIEVLHKANVGRDYPFNGLNLRLFLWKSGLEILVENNLLITGTGSATAQNKLNEKIIKYNLYQGVENTNDHGFLNYNFHNQYLETTIKTGIWGLIALLSLLGTCLFWGRKELKFVIILLFFLLITESLLEMQQGAVLSSFLIGLLVKNSD